MAQTVTTLPSPNLKRETLSVMEAYNSRRSTREFADKQLSLQDLSDLLWAAQGKNRQDGRLTSPTAMNRQEIKMYVFTKDGISLYNPQDNTLTEVKKGDHRGAVAGAQAFAKNAPAVLLFVADAGKFGSTDEHAKQMMAADAGIVSENVNVFCSAAGLVTVTRAFMDKDAVKSVLGLKDGQEPILNNPVGYPKK